MIDPISGPAYGRRVSVPSPEPFAFLLRKLSCFSFASFPYRLVGALVQASSVVVTSGSEPTSLVALRLE